MNEKEQKTSTFQKLSKAWFIIFNLAYIIAFSVYTGHSLVKANAEVVWLPYALGAFILVFWAIFIVILVQGSKKTLKNVKKDYKSSFKVIKKLFKLVNLFMAASMIANTIVNDKDSLFALIMAGISIVYVVFQIINEVIKYIKRKKKQKINAEKEAIDKSFVGDMTNIYNDTLEGLNGVSDKNGDSIENSETIKSNDALKAESNGNETNSKFTVIKEGSKTMLARTKQYSVERKTVGKKKN